MKIEYEIKNISGKDKSLCIGDLIRYYGETKYKLIESVQRLNNSQTTKGMVSNLLSSALKNPMAASIFDNLEELSKKDIFKFTIDEFDPLVFDNGKSTCDIILCMGDEYFAAKAVYGMMKPGFRKIGFEEHVIREKESWLRWFEKNLNEYTHSYTKKVLEK